MKGNKVGVVLQARMGSKRLPGKVLLPFGKTNLLGWIVSRLKHLPWKTVVATSDLKQDEVIVEFCNQITVDCFTGSEQDVLDRYYQCAKSHSFAHVVRLTADNPFTDIEELIKIVNFHVAGGYDYSHNYDELPKGVGVEVFSMAALADSWKLGNEPQHREHVNEFILENPGRFSIGYLEPTPAKRCRKLALTIDTASDYNRIKGYLTEIADSELTTERIINQCLLSA